MQLSRHGIAYELQNGQGQFQVIDLSNVTERNVGSFSLADIEVNGDFAAGTGGEALCQ